jgi:hypothetical protein
MSERKYTKQLPSPVGYMASNQWNIQDMQAKYLPQTGMISLSLGKRSLIGGAVDSELCLTIAGWRALITAVTAVMPTPFTAELFDANVSGEVSA